MQKLPEGQTCQLSPNVSRWASQLIDITVEGVGIQLWQLTERQFTFLSGMKGQNAKCSRLHIFTHKMYNLSK
jgi:hypothetical protein